VRAIEGTIAPTKKETNMSVNYGSKRTVVGAHYGLRDWLSQRVTAALMVLFTVVVLVQLVASKGPIGYDLWAGIFSAHWMKVLTFSVIVAMAWHVWVGVRDIFMDYIKPVGLRLALQVFTIVGVVSCAGWGIQVLWRL
jgi:succinate dehydrogenase / fumarate reductase membrane anchor subunit